MSLQEEQVVVFRLNQEEYGLAINSVREIIKPSKITSIPQAPDWVEGVIKLRDSIIPVLDLRKSFNFVIQEEINSKIIILEMREQLVGIMVDSVEEVLRFSANDICPVPKVTGEKAAFISGIGKIGERILILLEAEKLLDKDQTADIEQIMAEISA